LTIDPLNFAPGSYPLAIRVTDVDGDSGVLETEFEIAALPSTVTLNTAFDAPLTEPQIVTLDAGGQTAAVLAGYRVVDSNGEVVAEFQSDDAENSFPFTLDPFTLTPGDYTLSVDVLNEGGALVTSESAFSVGAVAPQNVTISGVEAEQELSEPTTITVDAQPQQGVEIVSVTAQLGSSLAPLGDDLTIVPFDYPPGPAILTAIVEDSNGLTSNTTVPVVIAALAPEVTLGEIPADISAAAEVPLDVTSQTRITEITFQVDEGEAQSVAIVPDQPLPAIPLDAQVIGDGEHTLTVTVSNAGGESTSVSQTFTVQLPTPTVAIDMTGTANAVAFAETGTASAFGTLEAQDEATATAEFQATS
ncbi:MAG: hypothetical protein KC496_19025, partial [Anaerolineae bacterium]|nr:hypothetical protein [Anaerolineae bacterium]